ncbi:MAG: sodium ion-translocating decarboxylase subunit beta, partial [Clostridia bacterium]|nr:sodium ion-translocating decarboxylase subunit beta [Clostridia bacterium]
MNIIEAFGRFFRGTGFFGLDWKTLVMYLIVFVLAYFAIVRKFEPLLLLPIAFGMLLANLPSADLMHLDFFFDEHYFGGDGAVFADQLKGFLSEFPEAVFDSASMKFHEIADVGAFTDAFRASPLSDVATLSEDLALHVKMSVMVKEVFNNGGLVDILYLGVKLGIYPALIFMGVGAMTDFSPLIANPKSLVLGAAAQFGVFAAFFAALFLGFSPMQAGAIGIIGGADGPTAILVTKQLAPELLGAIAIAAYSYMALIPLIQPPFMKLLTTKKERAIVMENPRKVSRVERVIFPILVTLLVTLIVPDAAPLVGFLMLGNLFNVSGVTERLSKTAQNEL